MTTDAKDSDYSHNAWLVLIHENPMGAAMAAHLLRKERDEAVQALADVRTLDEYDPDWMARGALPGGFCAVRDRCSCEEARAKAAAWVRGLK